MTLALQGDRAIAFPAHLRRTLDRLNALPYRLGHPSHRGRLPDRQMNVTYYLGCTSGWVPGESPETARERTISSHNRPKPPEASLPP